MNKLGRKPRPGVIRTSSGRPSRSRAALIASGDLVHTDWAVYFAECDGLTKIGFSGSLDMRLSTLSWNEGKPARIVGLIYVPTEEVARVLERKCHSNFKANRVRGEWFELSRSDILGTLSDCRKIGLKTVGGDRASGDVRILSGVAFASDHDLAGSS